MRRFLLLIVSILLSTLSYAQSAEFYTIEITESGDTIYILPPQLDSTMLGRDIVSVINNDLNSDISVKQSDEIRSAFSRYKRANSERKIVGYRIRIFFDNSQDARVRSSEVASEFTHTFPSIRVYRNYTNPYFKVTVGDFRTKSDALKFKKTLEGLYPAMFVVKEYINYPAL